MLEQLRSAADEYKAMPGWSRNHPANAGKDFTFDGSISEEVLKNYLSRSMNISVVSNPSEGDYAGDMRLVLNTGAKYLYRAGMCWEAETEYETTIERYKSLIDTYHAVDPDIVFEANMLETVFTSCERTPIPAWLFEAFGLPAEDRSFSYERMLFKNGRFVDYWGKGQSVPDINRTETQMYFYYRATRYIDAGFEGIHWCQLHLVGAEDTDFANYHKVLSMARSYARVHARRHLLLCNGSTNGVYGPDGKLLLDFHSYPTRGVAPAGSADHAPTEDDPQPIVFQVGHLDAIYQKSLGGVNPNGWSCEHNPYIVELDNNWTVEDDMNIAFVPPGRANTYGLWGMDDISWYANQPAWYRHQWLVYAVDWFRENDPAGFFCMPGNRPAFMQNIHKLVWYYAHSKERTAYGWGDEEAIRQAWIHDAGR